MSYTSNAPLARYNDPLNLPQGGGVNNAQQEESHRKEQRDFLLTAPRQKAMPAEEHAAKHREENEGMVKQYKYVDQTELETFFQGTVLSHQQFIAKLRLIRSDAFYNDFSRMGRIGINFVENGQAVYSGTTVQNGWSPEFSQIRQDAHGVGKEEKYRGWRTTLDHLLHRRFVREEDVNRVFGRPGHKRGERYLKHLWEYRNA